jgi:hypothetical protein
MMGPAVYVLGTLTTLACGILLLRGYFRGGNKLLLWSAVCFLGLAVSNALVFADLVLLPNIDLYFWRLLTAVISMVALTYGLIWESE